MKLHDTFVIVSLINHTKNIDKILTIVIEITL